MNHLSDDRIRLQKYMSECGVASRRKSEELIAKGAVKIPEEKIQEIVLQKVLLKSTALLQR